MDSIIEQQRRYHEERERVIDALVKETLHKKNTHRDNINSEHRTKALLDRYFDATGSLVDIYSDSDSSRRDEIRSISAPNEFSEFYSRLRSIRDFYRLHPGEVSVPMSLEFEEYTKMRESNNEDYANLVDFKDEEGYGKYLDLHEHYDVFLNLKGSTKVDYITYLTTFDRFFEISKEKKGGDYRKYLQGLVDYLYGYLVRIKPLTDFDAILEEARAEFMIMWKGGNFPGWPNSGESGKNRDEGTKGVFLDLNEFSSWEELAPLGLERLKSALIDLGLKCGGTVEDRAKRLFSTKGKKLEELEPSLFSKDKKKRDEKESEKWQETALLECQIYKLIELLSEERSNTKENVTRKQARTAGEKEESEEEVEEESEEEEDDDDIPYNPKNLPLGWDGKPIPYWLYKLHGLNISYNCEICGNFTYKGPKAFQRHFAEWRHAHGMRCLGIPNTAHFANVTQIEDALGLWEKLKGEKTAERWVPEQEEEYEDSMGNVVSKKVYEDLKRQGLL